LEIQLNDVAVRFFILPAAPFLPAENMHRSAWTHIRAHEKDVQDGRSQTVTGARCRVVARRLHQLGKSFRSTKSGKATLEPTSPVIADPADNGRKTRSRGHAWKEVEPTRNRPSGDVDRGQVRDGAALPGRLLPIFIALMMSVSDRDGVRPLYPAI
jgi:hypothetical protein